MNYVTLSLVGIDLKHKAHAFYEKRIVSGQFFM